MQSFLQYRRFRKHVEAQYERDKTKAQALNGTETPTSASTFSSAPTLPPTQNDDITDSRDPEKAEYPKGGDEEHLHKNHSIRESGPPIDAFDNAECRTPLGAVTTTRTKQSMGTAIGTTLTGIEVRQRNTKEGGGGNVFVVGYEGENDTMNPHNWSKITKIGATY